MQNFAFLHSIPLVPESVAPGACALPGPSDPNIDSMGSMGSMGSLSWDFRLDMRSVVSTTDPLFLASPKVPCSMTQTRHGLSQGGGIRAPIFGALGPPGLPPMEKTPAPFPLEERPMSFHDDLPAHPAGKRMTRLGGSSFKPGRCRAYLNVGTRNRRGTLTPMLSNCCLMRLACL